MTTARERVGSHEAAGWGIISDHEIAQMHNGAIRLSERLQTPEPEYCIHRHWRISNIRVACFIQLTLNPLLLTVRDRHSFLSNHRHFETLKSKLNRIHPTIRHFPWPINLIYIARDVNSFTPTGGGSYECLTGGWCMK